jgi:NAD(P)-dependent dehydrogenase (short-subunit alcohol dehydrogenase family)
VWWQPSPTNKRLAGKVVLITGAAGEIGSEMSRLFAAEGATVVLADIRKEPAEILAAAIKDGGGNAIPFEVDISNSKTVERMFAQIQQKFERLDVLVNNAIDITGDTTIYKLEEAAFDRTIEVCLKGTFLCTKGALPMLRNSGGGSIVTISSVNALFGFAYTAYTAAKGALISMMRLVAAEYGHWNVRSNVICPGTIETNSSRAYRNSNPDGYTKLMQMYPLGRIGTTLDVAQLALFLASDDSKFITGSVQVVDGGLLAGRNLSEQEFQES